MNRISFLGELYGLLAFMDRDARERALRRYEKMFDRAGPAREAELIASLGSPVRQVLRIEKEYSRAREEGVIPFAEVEESYIPSASDKTEKERPAQTDISSFPTQILPPVTPGSLNKLGEMVADLYEDGAAPEESADTPAGGTPDAEAAAREILASADAAASFAGEEPLTPEDDPDHGLPGYSDEDYQDEYPAEPCDLVDYDDRDYDKGEYEDDGYKEEPVYEAEGSAETEDVQPEERTPAPEPEYGEPEYEEADYEEADYEEPGSKAPAPSAKETAARADKRTAPPGSRKRGRESPGAGRVLGAILVTAPMILFWAVGFTLSIVLGAVFLALGTFLCIAGVYAAGYVLQGQVTFMPDLLLTAGAALGIFGLALLFLWLGIFLAVGGCGLVIRTSANIYEKILNRRRKAERGERA